MIHFYIGNGKGKTSAALGLAMRAIGAGKKVCLIRFLKPRSSAEMKVLRRLDVDLISFNQRHPFFYTAASLSSLKRRVSLDLAKTYGIVKKGNYDVVILDEILYLTVYKAASDELIIPIIKACRLRMELILTGASASRRLTHLADYVSTIKQTKHPFERGISARKGIEY